MVFKIVAEQEKFIFTLADSLPVAEAACWGGRWYVQCCPLCGCVHELRYDQRDGAVCEPVCSLKITHPKVYDAWRVRHPEAAKHCKVMLKYRRAVKVEISEGAAVGEAAA